MFGNRQDIVSTFEEPCDSVHGLLHKQLLTTAHRVADRPFEPTAGVKFNLQLHNLTIATCATSASICRSLCIAKWV